VAAIEVRDLTKRYRQGEPNEVLALGGVTLSVQAGEFVSVAGRSGSGKTTLLHCMGLLVRPTSGQVVIDGIDTAALTDAQRAAIRGGRVGFVLQDRGLLPTLTALENVMLPLRYARIGRGGKTRARELLDLVGLADQARRRPDQLTAGQAQRVAIARAMIRAPAVVLADEPTGEVDDEASDELLYLMQQLSRVSGVACVIATHDADVAFCMDRVIRVSGGRVVSDRRTRPMLNAPAPGRRALPGGLVR
jgi:putative ABC transport system ATP-binding protein